MLPDTVSDIRALIADLDALSRRIDAAVDDAASAAYLDPRLDGDRVDALYCAAERATLALASLRASI